MKARLLLIICTIATFGVNATAQSEPKDRVPIWKWVIAPQYENTLVFSEGLAAAKQDGKWGFINKDGEFVIPPQFEGVQDFSDSMAAIKQKNKWGFVNKTGEIVIKPKYLNVHSFVNEIARVERYAGDDDYYITKTGKDAVSAKGNNPNTKPAITASRVLYPFAAKGKFGFIDINKKMVIEPQFDASKHFSEGLAAVKQKGKFGFITFVSPDQYIKKYVNVEIADSLRNKTDENLQSPDYQQWIDSTIQKVFDKAVADYIASPMFMSIAGNTEMSANNNTFNVKIPNFGQFIFEIEDADEAKILKENWKHVSYTSADFIYAIDNNTGEDKVIPSSITIKHGKNSYTSNDFITNGSFTEISINNIVIVVKIQATQQSTTEAE